MISNGLSSTACLCGGSGTAMHLAATGGMATLTMACDTDCSSFDGGAGMASFEVSGPQIASHRVADAAVIDLANPREERGRGCQNCRDHATA